MDGLLVLLCALFVLWLAAWMAAPCVGRAHPPGAAVAARHRRPDRSHPWAESRAYAGGTVMSRKNRINAHAWWAVIAKDNPNAMPCLAGTRESAGELAEPTERVVCVFVEARTSRLQVRADRRALTVLRKHIRRIAAGRSREARNARLLLAIYGTTADKARFAMKGAK
jgi:hypothetical protein